MSVSDSVCVVGFVGLKRGELFVEGVCDVFVLGE